MESYLLGLVWSRFSCGSTHMMFSSSLRWERRPGGFPTCARPTRGLRDRALREYRGSSGLLSFSSIPLSQYWKEWPRLPSTARMERAHSDRARSASKEGTWPRPSPALWAGIGLSAKGNGLDGFPQNFDHAFEFRERCAKWRHEGKKLGHSTFLIDLGDGARGGIVEWCWRN